jgi:hypothetical protein
LFLCSGRSACDGSRHRWPAPSGEGDLEVVKILLAAGANPKAKPAGGHTLVDYARGPFAQEIRTTLEQSDATKGVDKRKRRSVASAD